MTALQWAWVPGRGAGGGPKAGGNLLHGKAHGTARHASKDVHGHGPNACRGAGAAARAGGVRGEAVGQGKGVPGGQAWVQEGAGGLSLSLPGHSARDFPSLLSPSGVTHRGHPAGWKPKGWHQAPGLGALRQEAGLRRKGTNLGWGMARGKSHRD